MKRLLASLLCMITCLWCIGLVGCKHECVFEKGWLYDEEYHWHECNSDICDKYQLKAEHVFSEGYCPVCHKKSINYETAEEWVDALKLFEEDFHLEHTSVIDGEEKQFVLTRVRDNIFVKYGDAEEDCYYLSKEGDKYYRYLLDGKTWIRVEDIGEAHNQFTDVRFESYLYEWYTYDQADKKFYAEHIDNSEFGGGADIDAAQLQFYDGKLTLLKHDLVYGSYEEKHEVTISYDDVRLALPKIEQNQNLT